MADLHSGILVIGIGNEFRGDDAIGVLIARAIRKHAPPTVTVIEHQGDCALLSELWRSYENVVIVDAVSSGAPPGTIHIADPNEGSMLQSFRRSSSHHIGVAETIELARTLGILPRSLQLIGIEGKDFSKSLHCSAQVRAVIDKAVRTVTDHLRISV